jgi:hypothetical protein
MPTVAWPEILSPEVKSKPSAAAPMACTEPAVDRTAGGLNDRRVVRRRGTQSQGQALELLGHSIEYLVDSRFFTKDRQEAKNDSEAVQILMRMSRAVFEECAEVISLERRLKRFGWKLLKGVTGYDRRKG